MGSPWILAVDLGTGGIKIGAVSMRGEILARVIGHIDTTYLPDGGAVQDPAQWWDRLTDGVRSVIESKAVAAGDLVAVGLTGQWGSTVPVDAEGNPVGACLLWSDTRGGRFSAKAMGGPVSVFGYSPAKILRWVQLTGGAPSPNGSDPLGHELYLRNCEPKVYAMTRALLEPLDYLGLKLTGRMAATPASMILSWLTDIRPGSRSGYVPELVRRSGRDPKRLPPLQPTGSVLGAVTDEVGRELGIPCVPVVCGVPDLHSAFLGSGAVAPYEAHITISTTSWIACEVPFKRTDVVHQIATVPALRAGAYLVANNHDTAGLCLKWFKESVAGADSFEDVCADAAKVPAGSGGVIFTPWLKGERSPVDDRTLRGAFLNVSLATGREDLSRAVLEGVAFNARWLFDAVERFVRRRLPSLRILGGGAQSDLWCQVHADILDRRIERVAEPTYANLRGAALFAAISLGRISVDDVRGLVRVTDTFEPEPKARLVYEPMYTEFKRFYGQLHSSYARLNRPSDG